MGHINIQCYALDPADRPQLHQAEPKGTLNAARPRPICHAVLHATLPEDRWVEFLGLGDGWGGCHVHYILHGAVAPDYQEIANTWPALVHPEETPIEQKCSQLLPCCPLECA